MLLKHIHSYQCLFEKDMKVDFSTCFPRLKKWDGTCLKNFLKMVKKVDTCFVLKHSPSQ